MNKSQILKVALIIELILLLGNTVAVSRDYQDSWILESLEIPFTIFMVTFVVYFFIERKISWLIVFVLIVRFAILAIPNLKYPWFQGVAIDQHRHYRLAQDIYDQGQIRIGDLYSGTPHMHLSFVIYSMTTGLDVIDSVKFFPIITWLIFPLIIYIFMKNIDTTNISAQKYALLFACIPVKAAISLVVIGTLFGPLLIVLLLHLITKSFQRMDRRNAILLVTFSLVLAMTHSFSSILFTILLVSMYFISYFVKKIEWLKIIISDLRSSFSDPMLTLSGISLTWFVFISTARDVSLRGIYSFMGEALGFVENPYSSEFIAPRFFEIGFLNGLKVILQYHGADFFLILFSLIGLAILYKLRTQNKILIFLSLYLISSLLFEVFGFITSFGWNFSDRVIRLLLVITPIFAGISFQYLRVKTRKKVVPIILISLFVLISTIQFYKYPPLLPAASSLPNFNLPDDEPIRYRNSVNTIYQRNMIAFAEKFFTPGTRFASDSVTRMQTLGLIGLDFSRNYVYYYPLDPLDDPAEYDHFLIHIPGKGGVFNDRAETVTKSLILSSISNSNILFTNGESYVLSNR